MDAQSSISGDLLLTTVSELTLIPQKSHHNQAVSCFAINDALPEPIQQLAYLNVQSEFLFYFFVDRIGTKVWALYLGLWSP